MLQALRKEVNFYFSRVDEAVAELERNQVRASLADALHDGHADGLVVHPVGPDEKPADDDLRRPLVEKAEEFPELCDGERLRSGVHLSPEALVGRNAGQPNATSTELVKVCGIKQVILKLKKLE